MFIPSSNALQKAKRIFRQNGGTMRTRDALKAGIHRSTLYAMRDTGQLICLARGLYQLSRSGPTANPDLLTVAARNPKGVVCLISALAFHRLTTQIPHEVDLALPQGVWSPQKAYPPVRIFRFSDRAMQEGIERHKESGITIRIFNAEKTLADCFKFRNKIGLDVAIEALRMYWRRGRPDMAAITRYATIDRVTKVMRPYLEGML